MTKEEFEKEVQIYDCGLLDGAKTTKEEIKNKISEHKECCKKLAEEYRQRYNEDKTNKLALNMFYHNVIAYNNFETILSMIEDRNSMIMCFSEPPILTEKTVEVELNRIAELEKENAELRKEISVLLSCKNCPENKGSYICKKEYENKCLAQKIQFIKELQEENAELKEQLSNVRECFISASSGDDFEMAESAREVMEVLDISCYRHKDEREKSKLTKAKEIISELLSWERRADYDYAEYDLIKDEAEQFISEVEK